MPVPTDRPRLPAGSRPPATVGEAGEREMLHRFTEIAAAAAGPGRDPAVLVDSGDDAAVITAGAPVVVTTDTLVEGRHFRLGWSTPEQVGRRAVIQAAADVAAMGGRATGVIVSIGAPGGTPVGVAEDINRGIAAAAADLSARLLGGDLVATTEIVLTVTVFGELAGTPPIRLDTAAPGDVLALSGPVGDAAAGLAVLTAVAELPADAPAAQALRKAGAAAAAAFAVPVTDLKQGVIAAAAGASAMTDVSDGLVEELITLSVRSGVALDVSVDRLPRSRALIDAATALDVDPRDWLIAGGEDHQLLACFPETGQVPAGWTIIGSVAEAAARPTLARPAVSIDGRPAGALRGWQSFDPVWGDA